MRINSGKMVFLFVLQKDFSSVLIEGNKLAGFLVSHVNHCSKTISFIKSNVIDKAYKHMSQSKF